MAAISPSESMPIGIQPMDWLHISTNRMATKTFLGGSSPTKSTSGICWTCGPGWGLDCGLWYGFTDHLLSFPAIIIHWIWFY